MKYDYDSSSPKSILEYSKQIENRTLRQTLHESPAIYNAKNKGALGHTIERDFFGYEINPRKEADFKNAEMELKVIPVKEIKKNKNSDQLIKQLGMSVKERVILSKINYKNIINETWETTELHHKLNRILMMFYMYGKDVSIYDLEFLLSSIWEPFEEDLPYLQKDWEFIQNKVASGNAHELSEGDTLLLGACTKGVNKKSLINQPNSSVKAMQRAYSLKRSYVDHIFNILYSDKLFKKAKIIPLNIYEKILHEFSKIQYANLEELFLKFNIDVNRDAKQFLYMVTSHLFEALMGITADDFNKNNISQIEIKTILLKKNNVPKESMSFEQIKFDEIVENDWIESEFRSKFENKKMLWVIYKTTETYTKQKELELKDIHFIDIFYWNMPNSDLDTDVKDLWVDTVDDFNHFKKISETKVSHVRPKAVNSNDTSTLKSGIIAPKKSFWLNSKYVAEQINIELSRKGNRFY
ncbi:MAG: Sau3AI family type II restriction endonuclease [Bacillota bacterium]|nr:Sau3AI family type II restriction endonuclease [Bacillota bacterium]